jgi:hypothetical protein
LLLRSPDCGSGLPITDTKCGGLSLPTNRHPDSQYHRPQPSSRPGNVDAPASHSCSRQLTISAGDKKSPPLHPFRRFRSSGGQHQHNRGLSSTAVDNLEWTNPVQDDQPTQPSSACKDASMQREVCLGSPLIALDCGT